MSLAVRVHQPGPPQALQNDDVDLPDPGPSEVRLRHTAIGLNLIDTYHRSGLYPLPSLPHAIGIEAAGVVDVVGRDVVGLRPGDRVAYVGGVPGAYAEARTFPADRLVPLPDDVSDETAAAALVKGMTVGFLVRATFRVERGMTVLWHAAAGGVGLIACQWLRALGATVIGTVGSDEKAALAREHGCTHTIVYGRDDFVARARELTGGKGVDVVYDSVGRATLAGSLDSLARRGMLVSFGNASGPPEPVDPLLLSRKGSLFLTRPTLFDHIVTREELLERSGELFGMIRSGAVRIEVRQRWPLARAVEAHQALESRATTGCSILMP